jgi:hypothetical protein
VARYVNAFPGTPGDYRAWIGGIRAPEDVTALLDNLHYAYLRAKVLVLEEELASLGEKFPPPNDTGGRQRMDDPTRAYKILVCDLVGLKMQKTRRSQWFDHIEGRAGVMKATGR